MAVTHVQRSALLPFAQADLFAMVADVRAYPDFLPWCDSIEVLSESAERVEARVNARAAGVSQSFITCNQMYPNHCIELSLVEGPFEQFAGRWEFTALGDGSVTGCKLRWTCVLNSRARTPFCAAPLVRCLSAPAPRWWSAFASVQQRCMAASCRECHRGLRAA